MSDDDNFYNFTTPEEFNEKTSVIIEDAWTQVEKASSFFSGVIKSNGPDTFASTIIVFNCYKEIAAVVTSRSVEDKEDMYSALCEMLFLPVSIHSELFIVLTDSRIRDSQSNEVKHDAMIMSFVSPDFCSIYTIPYTIDSDNVTTFDYQSSYLMSVTKSDDDDAALNAANDMLELFYIFSHTEGGGPFHVDDVFSFFDDNNFLYEIINKDNLKKKDNSFVIKG